MSYKQVLPFQISMMGTRADWCLQNCRLGFNIQRGTFASAAEDRRWQESKGYLHPISELPTDISVPVYTVGNNANEHVVVYDRGAWYSDGNRINRPTWQMFGWGEFCDGVRVVEYSNAKPTKSIDEVAKEVIAGKWGNGEQRAAALRKAGYSYTQVQNRVNELLGSTKQYYTIVSRDCLSTIAAKFGTTVNRIMAMNPSITNPDIIYAGQTIRVR